MKITANTYKGLVKWVFGQRSSGRISPDTEEDFMRWGNSMLKACRGKGFSTVDIPPRFLALYRGFADSDANGVDFELPDSHQRIPRNTQMVPPQFDGPPRLESIPGTPLSYVANSGTPIIRVDEQSWYAWQYDVCFVASSVDGPWAVATSIPAVIYSIPPSFLFYYITYVQVYGSTPDAVYVGCSTEGSPRTERSFMKRFEQLTKGTKRAFEGIESARRSSNDRDMALACRIALAKASGEQRRDAIARILADPEKVEMFEFLAKVIGERATTFTSASKIDPEMTRKVFTPGISPGDSFGGGMFLAAAVSSDVLYGSWQNNAWKDLGVRVLTGARTNFVEITNPGQAMFITPLNQGQVSLQSDLLINGTMVDGLANTVGVVFDLAMELVADGKTALAEAILTALSQAHGKALDYAAFSGNGNDDLQNGLQTGIFADAGIPTTNAGAGKLSVANLDRDDFINAIAVVAPSALVREPRWYISPAFLPKLLGLKDGVGPQYLLKTPAETRGEWNLVGFPVSWVNQAPSLDLAQQKVAAFGSPEGYLVAMHENVEIMASDSSKLANNIRQVRGLNRAWCGSREKTWLSTLKLAAQ